MKKMTIVSFQQLIVLPEEAHRLKDFKLAYKELDFFLSHCMSHTSTSPFLSYDKSDMKTVLFFPLTLSLLAIRIITRYVHYFSQNNVISSFSNVPNYFIFTSLALIIFL